MFFPSVFRASSLSIQDAIAIQMGEPTWCAPTTTLKIDDPFPARFVRRPASDVGGWLLCGFLFHVRKSLGRGGELG